jgi:Fe2+ transport system protein FeoA
MHDLIPLPALRRGESAEVCELVGSPERIRRLEELGLRHGVRLDMLSHGSPCIFRIEGTTLCFRDDELVSVMVRPRMSA